MHRLTWLLLVMADQREPTRLPLPGHLREFAHPAIEDAMVEMPAERQRSYRRLLAEEAQVGLVDGSPRPAARAMERFFGECAGEAPDGR